MFAPRYTLDDIERMVGEGLQGSVLPDSAQRIINDLAERVGAPTYVRTPVFDQPTTRGSRGGAGGAAGGGPSGGKRRRGNNQISDEDWEVIRTYESTQRVERDGDAAVLDRIRKHLNKISDANYGSQISTIVDIINEAQDEGNATLLNDIVEAILRTAKGNAFYAHLYARLVTDLSVKFGEHLLVPLQRTLSGYTASFGIIENCDPKKDYDRFCELNLENERRKATGIFLAHLTRTGVLDCDAVVAELHQMQKNMLEAFETEEGMQTAEHIADVCEAMITAGMDMFRDTVAWGSIKDEVIHIAGMAPKSMVGLSRKVVFKHMDIRDFIAKDPFA